MYYLPSMISLTLEEGWGRDLLGEFVCVNYFHVYEVIFCKEPTENIFLHDNALKNWEMSIKYSGAYVQRLPAKRL